MVTKFVETLSDKSKPVISISIDNCFVFTISVVFTIFSSIFQLINLEILAEILRVILLCSRKIFCPVFVLKLPFKLML